MSKRTVKDAEASIADLGRRSSQVTSTTLEPPQSSGAAQIQNTHTEAANETTPQPTIFDRTTEKQKQPARDEQPRLTGTKRKRRDERGSQQRKRHIQDQRPPIGEANERLVSQTSTLPPAVRDNHSVSTMSSASWRAPCQAVENEGRLERSTCTAHQERSFCPTTHAQPFDAFSDAISPRTETVSSPPSHPSVENHLPTNIHQPIEEVVSSQSSSAHSTPKSHRNIVPGASMMNPTLAGDNGKAPEGNLWSSEAFPPYHVEFLSSVRGSGSRQINRDTFAHRDPFDNAWLAKPEAPTSATIETSSDRVPHSPSRQIMTSSHHASKLASQSIQPPPSEQSSFFIRFSIRFQKS